MLGLKEQDGSPLSGSEPFQRPYVFPIASTLTSSPASVISCLMYLHGVAMSFKMLHYVNVTVLYMSDNVQPQPCLSVLTEFVCIPAGVSGAKAQELTFWPPHLPCCRLAWSRTALACRRTSPAH